MKKTIIVTIAFSLFAANAFAAGSVAVPTGVQGFNLSKNVLVGYEASTGKDTYGSSSKHKQGDKIYAGSSASSYIWYKNGTAGTDLGTGDIPGPPTTPSDSAIPSGWSQM